MLMDTWRAYIIVLICSSRVIFDMDSIKDLQQYR